MLYKFVMLFRYFGGASDLLRKAVLYRYGDLRVVER